MRIPVLAILICAVLAPSAHADPQTAMLRGAVYLDANRNGLRDAGERGVANVAVSNGSDVVRTDAAGHYALSVADGQTVFVIKPAGYALPNGDNGLPIFWRNLETQGSTKLKYGGLKASGPLPKRIDFALQPQAKRTDDAPLDVLVFGDPQPKNPLDVDYYRRVIVDPIRAQVAQKKLAAQFGISLGDIVSDDLSLYPAIDRVTASLRVPWLHVAGNHDQDEDAPDDAHATDSFRANYGPTTVAWEEDRAEFVALDDVVFQPGPKPAYIGGLREDQFAFLQSYLPTVPKDRLLVIAVHIPFFDAAMPGAPETFRHVDRERLFALLKDFPHVLLLSAHTHNQRMVLHDASDGWQGASPLREYNVGAACGAFWSGIKDANGDPISTMSDGTPNGYATMQVLPNGEYRLAWHVAQRPANDPAFNDAMALEAPKVLRHGAYAAWAVYANVFMGDATTKVEYRIDGGAWKPMQRVLRPDPRLVLENAADDSADRLRGYDRSAEAAPSTHLWRGVLATDLAVGTHRVEVREFDPWLGERDAQVSYRLDDASP
jgi:hypothetical protein